MESHEERAERAAEQHGDGAPDEVAAEGYAHDTGGNGGQMGIASEPDRPEMPDLPAPFGLRNIVD